MTILVFKDFVSVVDASGVNVASFYGALRHVEAAELVRRAHLGQVAA